MGDYVIQNGELKHYGVPGMKWGVRRYQNSDGSLTRLGKERLSEGASSAFPKYKGKRIDSDNKRVANRKNVIYKMEDEKRRRLDSQYNDYIKKHPNFEKSGVDNISRYERAVGSKIEKTKIEQSYKKDFVDRFIRDYGQATLKDLKINDSPQARQYVEQIIRDNEVWKILI